MVPLLVIPPYHPNIFSTIAMGQSPSDFEQAVIDAREYGEDECSGEERKNHQEKNRQADDDDECHQRKA